jgi:hypothetical protein
MLSLLPVALAVPALPLRSATLLLPPRLMVPPVLPAIVAAESPVPVPFRLTMSLPEFSIKALSPVPVAVAVLLLS